MKRRPWFWGTIGVWIAVTLTQYGLHDIAMHMSARAEVLQELHHDIDRALKADEQMSFQKHLDLNPDMFAGPVYKDEQPLDQQQQDLKGGALNDPKTVHVILFWQKSALERFRQQLVEPGLSPTR